MEELNFTFEQVDGGWIVRTDNQVSADHLRDILAKSPNPSFEGKSLTVELLAEKFDGPKQYGYIVHEQKIS